MNLEDIHSQLIINLGSPIILFVPESLITEELEKNYGSELLNIFFNKILIIENDGSVNSISKSTKITNLTGKNTQLDKNLFQLLELKESLKPYQFDFLIKKYYGEVNLFVVISEWLNKNLEKHFKDLDTSIPTYFSVQEMAYQLHFEGLQNTFGMDLLPNPKQNEILEKIESIVPPMSAFKKAANSVPETKESKKPESNQQKPVKEVLITNEEADRFLLETVFNVKF